MHLPRILFSHPSCSLMEQMEAILQATISELDEMREARLHPRIGVQHLVPGIPNNALQCSVRTQAEIYMELRSGGK